MYDIYSLGEPTKKRRSRKRKLIDLTIFLSIIAVVAFGGFYAFKHFLKANTTISQSQPLSYFYDAEPGGTQHIKNSLFTVDLPATWKHSSDLNLPPTAYVWRGTKKDDLTRSLNIYVNNVPASLAVNRILAVQTSAGRLNVTGETSDNCANFTPKSALSRKTGVAPAKQDGVSFICDMGNYERDVVAIGSKEGVNTITVTGPKTGKHRILLVYTDNSYTPDYGIFTNIVQSFRVL